MIQQSQRFFTILFLFFALQSVPAEIVEVYFIGNSLTMSTTLDRVHSLAEQHNVDLQFGSQLSGGKSLIRHLNYQQEPNQKWKSWETNVPNGSSFEPDENMYVEEDGELHRFGLHDKALAGHSWDKVVLQLYGGTLHDDLKAIGSFIEMAISNGNQPEFLIYSVWPNRPKHRLPDGTVTAGNIDYPTRWSEQYTASTDDTSKTAGHNYYSRHYVETLLAELQSRFPNQTIRLIPVGEVFYALDQRIKDGQLSGISDLASRKPELVPGIDADTTITDGVNILYADGHHLNPMPHQMDSLGIFVSGTCVATALTGKSPVGLSGKAYGLDDDLDAGLIQSIQEVILSVFENTPQSAFLSSNNSD